MCGRNYAGYTLVDDPGLKLLHLCSLWVKIYQWCGVSDFEPGALGIALLRGIGINNNRIHPCHLRLALLLIKHFPGKCPHHHLLQSNNRGVIAIGPGITR